MSAASVLASARAAGIDFDLDGEDLLLKASSAPPAEVLDLIVQHKAEILALLRPVDEGWSVRDWRAFFDERAAIAEFDGGLGRLEAERRAFDACVAEWLGRHRVRSAPDCCLACGCGGRSTDVLLPFGGGTAGHAWLHSECWHDWYAGRKAEAAAALTAMGIPKFANFPNDFGKNGAA